MGDVALVEDETAVERQWSSYGFVSLVAADIFTEAGEYLGKACVLPNLHAWHASQQQVVGASTSLPPASPSAFRS